MQYTGYLDYLKLTSGKAKTIKKDKCNSGKLFNKEKLAFLSQ